MSTLSSNNNTTAAAAPSSSSTKRPKGATTKCGVRVLDTVFFSSERAAPEWYFTTKSGGITRKKDDKYSTSALLARLSDFALSNPNNAAHHVGVVYTRLGERAFLTADELSTALAAGRYRNASDAGTFLQVYLQPHGGQDTLFVMDVARGPAAAASSSGHAAAGPITYTTTRKTFTAPTCIPAIDAAVPDTVAEQMKEHVAAVMEFCAAHRALRVDAMTAEFIVDDNMCVWLSSVSQCTATPTDAPAEAGTEPQQTKVEATSAAASHGDSGDAPAATSSTSLPSLRVGNSRGAAPAAGGGPVATPAAAASGHKDHMGDPLLTLEGAVYRSSMSADELPGLCAWVMAKTGLHAGGKSGPGTGGGSIWTVDLNRYHQHPAAAAASPTSAGVKQGAKQRRAKERQVLPLASVELMAHAEQLLLGLLPVASDDDFEQVYMHACMQRMHARTCARPDASGGWPKDIAFLHLPPSPPPVPSHPLPTPQAWRNCLKHTLLDLNEKVDPYGGTENVVVCGNTYTICKKLESLRDADFRRTKKPSPAGSAAGLTTLVVPMSAAAAPGSPTVMSMDLHGMALRPALSLQVRPLSPTSLPHPPPQGLQNDRPQPHAVAAGGCGGAREPYGHVHGPRRVLPEAQPDAAPPRGAQRRARRQVARRPRPGAARDSARPPGAVPGGVGRRRGQLCTPPRVSVPWCVERARPKPIVRTRGRQGKCPSGRRRPRPGVDWARQEGRWVDQSPGGQKSAVGEGAGRGQPFPARQGQGQ